jgi:hypothetical protein
MSFLSKPIDIVAVTETRLNSKSKDNVDLANYNFVIDDFPTSAGGVMLIQA